jgi:hypothetical protein
MNNLHTESDFDDCQLSRVQAFGNAENGLSGKGCLVVLSLSIAEKIASRGVACWVACNYQESSFPFQFPPLGKAAAAGNVIALE